MARPDLTVRGGGIIGLSIAWEAALRGARVRLIERDRIGAGASGGFVGALAPHTPDQWNPKKDFQLESLLMAEGWWLRAEAASGLQSGYGRTGRLQPLADQRSVDVARERSTSAVKHWGRRATWEVEPVAGSWLSESLSGLMVRDTLSARINPRKALAVLVGAIRAERGDIILGEADEAGPVVWATGVAGLEALSANLGQTVGGAVKGQAMLLAHDAGHAPQLLIDGLHIVPHADGTVAIGSTSERIWQAAETTDEQLDALHRKAVEACPALLDARILERWAGLRPRARSRAPMLGAWPGRPDTFVANGGFKIGFGMAPKMAAAIVDLVLEGRDAIPEAFRVEASQ